jgi:(p)ppGpp synthase/HD superfamily hydrolase
LGPEEKALPTLERAIEIAASAHAGQLDKAGQPYVLHPLRVMLAMSTFEQKVAAILHDVVEDTAWTIADLEQEGFPHEVIEAIKALTKLDGESRPLAARRAAMNPIARLVKLADVRDNMDLGRIKNPTAKDHERLKEYEHVREILLSAGA